MKQIKLALSVALALAAAGMAAAQERRTVPSREFTVRIEDRCYRFGAWFQHRCDVELPSVMGQPLPEIALPVQERDTDERQSEIAGRFGVVAGEHPETTGVNGQRGVDAELGGEIGDGSLDKLGLVLADPGRRGVGRHP